MSIVTKYITVGSFNMTDVRFPITKNGMQITIGSGTGAVSRETFSIDTDVTYTAGNIPNAMGVYGYIVKDKTSGDYSILVDEIEDNGVDTSYDFSSGNYILKHILFQIFIPASTSSLDNLTLQVYHTVESST